MTDDKNVSHSVSGVTITAASKALGVSVRTVQRRLDSGVLRSIESNGRRLVLLDSSAKTDAPQGDILRANVASRDVSQSDFAARYVAQIEEENRFLKLQIEEGNRNAAELRAALREALKSQPRQLMSGTPPRETKKEGPQSGAATKTPLAPTKPLTSPGNAEGEASDDVDLNDIDALIHKVFNEK